MVLFEELPFDIALRIIESLNDDSRTLCDLRLVSKLFNDLAMPFLFSSFSCSPSDDELEGCYAISSDLSARKTSVFALTKRLRIKMGIWWDPFEEQYAKPWFELWNLMLPTMRNLQTLEWGCWLPQLCPPDWVNAFIRVLGEQKSLTDLMLSFHFDYPSPVLSFQPIGGLRKFSVRWCLYRGLGKELIKQISSLLARCPNLETFAFFLDIQISSHRNVKPAITLKDLLDGLRETSVPLKLRHLFARGAVVDPEDFHTHLRHFRSLEELGIELDPSPSASDHIGEICGILRKEGIQLKACSTTSLHHPNVIRYLTSFSGIENFSLQSFDSLDDSPASVDYFFSALVQHRHSLKKLKLDVNRKSPWVQALRSHFQKEAGIYISLRVLRCRVYVTPDEITSARAQSLHRWLDTVMGFPLLQRLECPYVTYKTGTYYFKRDSDDLIERDFHSPCTLRFVRQAVEEFRQNRKPRFDIDTRQSV